MKNINVKNGQMSVPEIGLGLMRLPELDKKGAQSLIETALELGINFFDHADIYAGGRSEELFSQAIGMNPSIREKMILQSKCGIESGVGYNFAGDYILKSVDGILNRLNTDYLDVLLLHRPDTLLDPAEVAESFIKLKQSGKVKHFGVSNQNAGQMALLSKYMGDIPLLFNQLQFSLAHCPIVDEGFYVNTLIEESISHSSGILEYCRLADITIQAWSPFQYGHFSGVFIGSDKYKELNKVLDELAEKYSVSPNAIAVAWILRHPAKIQTIVGTTNRERLIGIAKASDINLSHSEWYRLYKATGKEMV